MQDEATTQTTENNGLIRLGGVAVVLSLAIHMFVNGMLKEFPPQNPSLAELKSYLSAEASTWAMVHGLKYLALVGLVLFAAGAYARTCRSRGALIAGWGVVGLLGTAIHVTNAMIANGIEVLAFYDFSRLSEQANLFWLLFYVVRTLFTAEVVAWGLVIFGFSMAGFQTRRIPRWIAALGFFSSAACVSSGVFIVSILTEGWALALIDAATLSGLAWFASIGIFMMLRGDA